MKKLLAVVLLVCMLMTGAVAEDVAAMSDDELKALYVAVKEELMARKLWDEAILPSGIYQAGKALPEGIYECTALSNGVAISWGSYENYLNQKNRASYTIIKAGEKFTLALYGDVVWDIDFNSTVRPFVGLSW